MNEKRQCHSSSNLNDYIKQMLDIFMLHTFGITINIDHMLHKKKISRNLKVYNWHTHLKKNSWVKKEIQMKISDCWFYVAY